MKKTLKKINLPRTGKKASLGVAIENHSLLYVEVVGSPKGISVSRFGEVPLETDSGDAERPAELGRVFGALHRRSSTKSLQITIPDSTATFFEMTLPESDPFLLEHMVEREVKKALGNSHNFVLQTDILYREKNNTKIAVTLLSQDLIDNLKVIAKENNFKLEYVGLATEATAELVRPNDIANIFINIKEKESSITILSKGSLVLEETIPTGTSHWAQKIAEYFDIKQKDAEEALFFEGIPISANLGASPAFRNELHKIVQSAEKLFLYWHVDCRKEKECRVGQITLVGAGASIPGLVPYLEASLKIEVKNPEPFNGLKLSNEIPEMTESESLKYLPALAVALKGLRK